MIIFGLLFTALMWNFGFIGRLIYALAIGGLFTALAYSVLRQK